MQRFVLTAGIVFAVVALAWLFRLAMGFPISVWGYDVPRWFSVIPMIITGSFAIWAISLSRSQRSASR